MTEKRRGLEDRIFFDIHISKENTQILKRKGQTKEENAIIKDAYFGRLPNPGLRNAPIGLYITVKLERDGCEATAIYTKRDDIDEFMRILEAHRTEQLKGHIVTAHMVCYSSLVGLSL